jgi:hypothetical protein
MGWATFWAHFFTNSSGHSGRRREKLKLRLFPQQIFAVSETLSACVEVGKCGLCSANEECGNFSTAHLEMT